MALITAKQASQILDVSEATVRNWVKHGYLSPVEDTKSKFVNKDVLALRKRIETGEIQRLRNRANKRILHHSFVPEEYVDDTTFICEIEKIRDIFSTNSMDLETSLFVLTMKQLVLSGEVFYRKGSSVIEAESFFDWKRDSVKRELSSWADQLKIDKREDTQNYNCMYDSLTDISHDDTVGIIYQSFLRVGSKSKYGAYYTPRKIVDSIFEKYGRESGKFLDPCCGTGQFLLGAVRCGYSTPELLHGYDVDGVAVKIARINLLLAFPDQEFQPKIFRVNALTNIANGTLFCETNHLKNTFTLIATNPPWGAAENESDRHHYCSMYPHITSGESFSLFLSKCIELAEENGRISFLLPESILNIKTHADIRKHILKNTSISAIYYLGRIFKGVFTPVIRLDLKKMKAHPDWAVDINLRDDENYTIAQSRFKNNPNFLFDIFLSKRDEEIISLLYERPHLTLKGNAEWALGIVTGDNKKYIRKENIPGTEPIYKGCDIEKYRINQPSSYIEFKAELFQQVAPEQKYRATEKLVYRFISKKLVFAYDTKGALTLNSANILLPKIENYPIKLILAFLNSSLFQFVFSKKFNTHKVLRGDLETLAFPILKDESKNRIVSLVEQAIEGADMQRELDCEIMDALGLSTQQIKLVLKHSKV